MAANPFIKGMKKRDEFLDERSRSALEKFKAGLQNRFPDIGDIEPRKDPLEEFRSYFPSIKDRFLGLKENEQSLQAKRPGITYGNQPIGVEPTVRTPSPAYKKGGMVKGYAKGGMVRGCGKATKGHGKVRMY